MKYRPDIDGLRALAVLAVVLYHVGVPGLGGGFVGVDVFFVISGYLITQVLLNDLRQTGSINWYRFYARRVRRLLPALLAVTSTVLAVGTFVLLPDPELRWLGQSVVASSSFTSNIFFWLKTGGYFDVDAETLPLLHTWSLAVEEQYYIIWPALLLVIVRIAGRGQRQRVVAAVAFAVVCLGSLVSAEWLIGNSPSAAFYWMPPRFWELSVGAVLALFGPARIAAVVRAPASVGWLSLVLLAMSIIVTGRAESFPGVTAIPAVVATAGLIGSAASSQTSVSRLLSLRPLVYTGKLSYSWYLIHWPMLVIVRAVTLEAMLLRDLAIATGSFGVAVLSYHFIEQPFRHPSHTHSARRAHRSAVAVGAVALFISASVGFVVANESYRVSRLTVSESELRAIRENRTARNVCPNQPPDGMVVDCRFEKGGEEKLLLVGDSHALAILPLAREVADELGWELNVLWDTGCPFVVGPLTLANGRNVNEDCAAENAANLGHILATHPSIGGIIMTGRASSYINNEDAVAEARNTEEWSRHLSDGLRQITALNVPVVLMHDVPHFEIDVPQCVVRRGQNRCAADRIAVEEFRSPSFNAERAAAVGLPGVTLVDPITYLCDRTRCAPAVDGEVLYRDRTHLSEAGARYLAKTAISEFVAGFS